MKKFARLSTVCSLTLLATSWWHPAHAQAGESNRPPEVSILWPRQDDSFSAGILIKIKTVASDLDGSVAQVQFFAETNLIGVVTTPPFNLIWPVDIRGAAYGTWDLKAVAVDNRGATTQSAPVRICYYTGGPPEPVLEIISPHNAAVFAAPATFDFSAEVLASFWGAGPVEFFVGTNGPISSGFEWSA